MAAISSDSVINTFYSSSFYIYPPDQLPSTTYEPSASSTTSTLNSAASSVGPSSTSSTSPSTTSATSMPSSSGLDGDDKEAFGVAVGLGIPIIIALTIIGLVFKRRRKQQQAPANASATFKEGTNGTAFSGNSNSGSQGPSELGSIPVPMSQAHDWYSQQNHQQSQPFLSELSAEGDSTR